MGESGESSVLEVFKKFDADDSGAISREELGEVLQALKESEPWEEEDIDNILAAADASGDGELQIEEFVKWVFAEDKEITQGMKSKATVKISGCSREDFNGDYVQKEGEYYYRRPIFYCEEQKKFLFFNQARGQWQLYWRTGSKASCRIKTTRSAHMPGEGKTWAVWKKKSSSSTEKGMIREADMKCEAEVAEVPAEEKEDPEELLQQAEPCVKFDEIYYKKIDGVVGNRAVYRQSKGEDDWGDTYVFYDKPDQKWKRANEATEGVVAMNTSRITKVASPEKAAWFDDHGKLDVTAIDTDGIPNSTGQSLTLNKDVPEGWKDSIGKRCADKMGRIRWLRGMALHQDPVLFADVEPADALQGSLGNCWLIAAMSAIAEFPSYLKNNIFQNKKLSKEGKYHVKLFDGRVGRWKIFMVDDYLPCSAYGDPNRPRLIFGKINDGKLCLPLIEKAFAKLYGSYSGLWSGWQPMAWFHLTGCDNFFRYSFTYESAMRWQVTAEAGVPVYSDRRRSKKLGVLSAGAHFHEAQRIGCWVKFKKDDGDGPESGWLMYYMQGKRVASRDPYVQGRFFQQHLEINHRTAMKSISATEWSCAGWKEAFISKSARWVSPEGAWQDLHTFDKNNHLMAATATYSADESDSGLVHKHAYSVLKVVEVEGFRLVSLRNPWGTDAEWNGPWSDRSPEWRAHPSIAKALNVDFQTEGTFWMDWEDWMYCMGQLKIMNCKMPTSRGDFHSTFAEIDEDGEPDAGGGNDFGDEADDFGGDIWITPPKGRGKIIACSGLGVNWNAPVLMDEGVLLQPGDTTQKFQNVPSCLIGMSYFGHPINVSAGNWNIEFEPPLTLYVWVMDGFCDSLEQVMPLQGWTLESAPGFQTDDGYKLHLLSKYIQEEDFYTGRWESFRTISSSFCGGLVGTYPLPKQPEVVVSSELPSESMVVGEAQELGGEVMGCSGLDIEWNAPHKMMAGALVNPGDRDFVFENVPSFLSGGKYIGTRTWPKAGTWTIEYEAPTILYVWIEAGEYNAGVDDALGADGWTQEDAGNFARVNSRGTNPLGVWSRYFETGSSYSIETTGLMVGGVVSAAGGE